MADTKELQARNKQEVSPEAEQTRPGRIFTPEVDICENDAEIRLLADMPGVAPEDLTIDLKDDTLTLSGDVKPLQAEGETPLLVEFEVGRFQRQFSLAETIDQNRITASLRDGVLHLTLPKHARATSRRISVSGA
jgi:HSP20 family molecular chaperone IbpA